MPRVCSIEGCAAKYYARSFCEKHYQRMKKYGDPLAGRNHAPLEERFWRYVDRRADEECWPWLAKIERNGYGRIQAAGKGSPSIGAHRLSFRLAYGFEPQVVMHRCDNPSCVNPAHLEAGTYKQNTQDMIAKGRRVVGKIYVGSDHWSSKLNEEKVRFIRQNPNLSHAEVGRQLGVAVSTVRAVRSGITWRHIK